MTSIVFSPPKRQAWTWFGFRFYGYYLTLIYFIFRGLMPPSQWKPPWSYGILPGRSSPKSYMWKTLKVRFFHKGIYHLIPLLPKQSLLAIITSSLRRRSMPLGAGKVSVMQRQLQRKKNLKRVRARRSRRGQLLGKFLDDTAAFAKSARWPHIACAYAARLIVCDSCCYLEIWGAQL